MPGITDRSTAAPLLRPRFISHGTLESRNIHRSRRFYEEVLGFEVVQVSPITLFIRLGGKHTYVVVESTRPSDMRSINHNGIDFASEEEVHEAHRRLLGVAEEYGITAITEPAPNHGQFSFHFRDCDMNCWEAIHLPEGGYSFRFEDALLDLTGRHNLSPDEMRAVFQRRIRSK